MRVVDVDSSTEKNILIGMIMSTTFLAKIIPIFDYDYFDVPASVTVSKWVVEYFARYTKAPQAVIQDIYTKKVMTIDEDDAEWIGIFLKSLSKEYEKQGFNESYLFDVAMRYFKRQKLSNSSKQVLKLLEQDKVEEAEETWLDSMKMPGDIDTGLNIFDPEVARQLMKPDSRFELHTGIGAFDQLAGGIKSEWFVAFMGPMKRGKTRILMHIAIHSALVGFNTVFISLESGYQDIGYGMWMNAGSLTMNKDNVLIFPEFENQEDKLSTRVRYVEYERPRVFDEDAVLRTIENFNMIARGTLKVKSYPAFTAGIGDINTYLDSACVFDMFTPHVIIIDYLGAMSAPKGVYGRDVYDINSKGLKAMSQQRKAIVISGHQGNKKTLDKLNMHPTDVPEDVRILANVDAIYGLNQTDNEKDRGEIRISVLMHRFRKFSRRKHALVLQQLEAGQFHLDSRIVEAPKTDVVNELGDYEHDEGG